MISMLNNGINTCCATPGAGYVVIYVDNQTIGKDVWFDNISIEHYTSNVIEENHYYPYGLTLTTSAASVTEQPYKYNGKELEKSFGLEMYDFGARMQDPQLGRWFGVDPLAEKAPGWTPYRYGFNNPIRYTDPTGMFEGDFIDETGRVIGNDGIDDGKVYVVKTTQTSFSTGQPENTPAAGISKKDAKATKDFIKNNSGNTEAFQNNSIAYDNSVEIVGSSDTRQAMVDIVNQDNGRGGTSDANNREYGESINRDGTVTQAPAGAVGNPLVNSNVSITLRTTFENQSTFHSHPSGTRTEGNTTGSWIQPPSYRRGDVQNSSSAVNYVFGRGMLRGINSGAAT
jgi:RHS repeat-associated protein